MGRLTERGQWIQKKDELALEHVRGLRTAQGTVALNGYRLPPVSLARMALDAEIDMKAKLRQFNLDLAMRAVDQELKDMKLDNDQDIRRKRIAFSLYRQQTLELLPQIFADEEYAFAREEGDLLDAMDADIMLLELALIEAKAAIDAEMESLKQELARLEDDAFPMEQAVLEAELETARRKLDLLDPIRVTIAAKKDVLLAKQALVPEQYRLADALQYASDVEKSSLPWLEAKAGKEKEYAQALIDELVSKMRILQAQLREALARKALVDADVSKTQLEARIEEARRELQEAAGELRKIAAEGSISLADERAGAERKEAGYQVDTIEERASAQSEASEISNEARLAAAEASTEAEITASSRVASASSNASLEVANISSEQQKDTARISATAQVTSTLMHAVGTA